jgi:hypothetical protein
LAVREIKGAAGPVASAPSDGKVGWVNRMAKKHTDTLSIFKFSFIFKINMIKIVGLRDYT